MTDIPPFPNEAPHRCPSSHWRQHVGVHLARSFAPVFGIRASTLLSDDAVVRQVKRHLSRPTTVVGRLVYVAAFLFTFVLTTTAGLALVALAYSLSAGLDFHRGQRLIAFKSQYETITAPAFTDKNGKLLGVPKASQLGTRYKDRALAVPLTPSDVPENYEKIIRALEQRGLDTFRTTPYGGDWVSTTMAGADWFRRGGASGLAQQTARVTFALGHRDEDPFEVISRKWSEATYGAALVFALKRQYGDSWRNALVMTYATVQPIAQSPEISGIYAGSEALFAVPPNLMTDAQAAVIASFARLPGIFEKGAEGRFVLSEGRWRRLLRRAHYGIAVAFANDPKRRDSALAELSRMPKPVLMGASPSTALIPIGLGELRAVARLASTSKIRLTVDRDNEVAFTAGMDRALQAIDQSNHLAVGLSNSSTREFGRLAADVVAFDADATGAVRHYYSTSQYLPLDRIIDYASAGKLVAALALPGHCSLRPGSVAWIFAKSQPQPLESLLRRCVSRAKLESLLQRFGFKSGAPDVFHAVSFGLISGTPRALVAAYAAFIDRARGGRGVAGVPHLLSGTVATDGTVEVVNSAQVSLDTNVAGSENIAFARAVLIAPTLPGGTVAGLASECPGIIAAKTGTTGDANNDGNRSRLLAGGFADGRAFLILIQARDGGTVGNVSRLDLLQLAKPLCERASNV
jgi:hypothetical protein